MSDSHITTYENGLDEGRPVREQQPPSFLDLVNRARAAVDLEPFEGLICQSCKRGHEQVPPAGVQCECGALVWS
jgi:hypothetical protein